MRKKARITVEASTEKKNALESLLSDSGLSLSEWLELQIQEDAAPNQLSSFQQLPGKDYSVELNDLKQIRKILSGIDWAFAKATTDYLSHDIHPYPAKFIPQIPRYLIAILSRRGEFVWDPFGGSGTTALEAILMGRRCISTDVNPIAAMIGKAKTLTLTVEEDRRMTEFLEEVRSLAGNQQELDRILADTKARWTPLIPEIPNLDSWFHQNAIQELAYIRWRIISFDSEPCRALCLAAFSRSILRASYQDAETRYAAKKRVVARTDIFRIFVTHLQTANKKVRALGPLLHFRKPDFQTLDLRSPIGESSVIRPNSVDLIVTSPPYPNATDYHLYHRFRLFWLGHDPRVFANEEIGSHLRHQKQGTGFAQYLEEMTQCLKNHYDALRPGRFAVLVLGDALFHNKIYKTAEEVASAAVKVGFVHFATLDRKVHSTKRSFISTARRLGVEQIIVLQKPSQNLTLRAIKPKYKLWLYEEGLAKRELVSLTKSTVSAAKNGDLNFKINALRAHVLKRLTFTQKIEGKFFDQEPTWQSILENGDVTRSGKAKGRKDPKYVTHGIHAYKGKFYPQLAKSLFNLAAPKVGSTVLDPFCGSGTVLLEAHLNGLSGLGFDINPLAIKIAKAKVDSLVVAPDSRDRLLASIERRLEYISSDWRFSKVFSENAMPELISWFPKPVLSKLGWVFSEIEQIGDHNIQELMRVLVSSIVREVSQQDPRDLRIRRRETLLTDAPVSELLRERIRDTRSRLRHFAEIANWAPEKSFPSRAILGDTKYFTTFEEHGIRENSIDLIVTSPPYATALPYIDTDRLSLLLLLGLTSADRQSVEAKMIGSREIKPGRRAEIDRLIEGLDFKGISSKTAISLIAEIHERNKMADVGFRRKNTAALLYLYFSEMSQVIANLGKVLKPNADALFVIGDNRTVAGGKDVLIHSGAVLQEMGKSVGWKLSEVIPITVTQENRLHNANSITRNEIIWFKSPV